MGAFKNAGGLKGAAREEKKDAKANKDAKRQKKENEKDKPKTPRGGAYGSWLAAKRSELQAQVPKGSSAAAVTKLAGEKWKKMSDADRKPWEEQYLKKAEYEKLLEEWKAKRAAGGDNGGDDGDVGLVLVQ